ncbi:MAG: hypothetical protein AB8B53_06630 [Flavobacteriales bacterium]
MTWTNYTFLFLLTLFSASVYGGNFLSEDLVQVNETDSTEFPIQYGSISSEETNPSGFSLEFVPVYVHPDEVISDLTIPGGGLNLSGYTTWVLYANLPNPDDFLTLVLGFDDFPLFISTEGGDGFFQHPLGVTAGPLNELLLPFAPALEYDSYVTIGQLTTNDFSTVSTSTLLSDPENPWVEPFEAGGDIILNSFVGGAWFILPQTVSDGNGNQVVTSSQGSAGDDLRVPIGQFTTNSDISAQVNIVIYPNGLNISNTDLPTYYGLTATTAIDDCVDCTEPILSGTPEPELSISCGQAIPEIAEVTASTNCNSDIEVTFNEEFIGLEPNQSASSNCAGVQPLNAFDDWAMVLFDIPGTPFNKAEYFVESSQVSFFESEENGSGALLTGVFFEKNNPEAQWSVTIPLSAGADWDTWSAIPNNSFKDDWDSAGDNYLDWTYYLISSEGAFMEGMGDLEGSFFQISHAPSTQTIGWQLGDAANNVGTNYGIGGWFYYDGVYVNSSLGLEENISGAGDVGLDLNCCPSYTISRTWVAANCDGVETSFTQLIAVTGEELTGAKYCLGDFDFSGDVSSGDLSVFLGDFNCYSGYCPCDLNDDGNTNSSDLSAFLGLIGGTCE